MLDNVLSKELLERYKSGEKEFSNINLQFAEISSNLENITIKNSRLYFVTFFNCIIKNVKFINCEIFYGSFNGGFLENTVFEKCKIDFVTFRNGILKSSEIKNSNLSWLLILSRPLGDLNITNSSQFKVLNNIENVSEKDAEELMIALGPVFDSLDISIKLEVKKALQKGAEDYGKKIKQSTPVKPYGDSKTGYKEQESGYGFDQIMKVAINAYNSKNQYETKKKKSYETNEKYK